MYIEVSRLDGDSVSYQQYAQAVLKTVTEIMNDHHNVGYESTTYDVNMESTSPTAVASPPCFWNGNMLRQADTIMGQKVSPSPLSEDNRNNHAIAQALDTVWSFLSTDRYDVQRLGFESLVHMTNPNRSGLFVAVQTTKWLLFPQTETQEGISRGILEFVCGSCHHNENERSAAEVELADLALVIFTQALEVAANESPLQTLDVATFLLQQRQRECKLVECLLHKMHGMETHPHRAYYAMQSLVALCRCVPELRSEIINMHNTTHDYRQSPQQPHYANVWSFVQAAQVFGDAHHLALATASHQLWLCLQQEA
ncbi:hypothetical protein ACA910_022044 [Epithemia clementina (nom. ined.)]